MKEQSEQAFWKDFDDKITSGFRVYLEEQSKVNKKNQDIMTRKADEMMVGKLLEENAALAAENERLRKAGDDLAVAWARVRTDYHTWDVAVKAWDAAKEGGAK